MRCLSVGYGRVRGAARGYRYFQPILYERHEQKNGRIVWKYVEHLPIKARRSYNLAVADAIREAKERGVEYKEGVKHLNDCGEV